MVVVRAGIPAWERMRVREEWGAPREKLVYLLEKLDNTSRDCAVSARLEPQLVKFRWEPVVIIEKGVLISIIGH